MDSVIEGIQKDPADVLDRVATLSYEVIEGKIANLAKQRERLLNTLPLQQEEVEQRVKTLESSGKLKVVYQRAIQIIKSRTNFLTSYEELDLIETIETGLDKRPRGRRIQWQSPSPEVYGGTGIYEPHRLIAISGEREGRGEILRSLGQDGTFPEAVYALFHEKLHDLHIPRGLKYLLLGGSIYRELDEAHTYRAATMQADQYSIDDIVDVVINAKKSTGEKVYPDLNPEIFRSSLEAIDKLQALGFTQREIVDLVRNSGEWDDKRGGFVNILNSIESLMAKEDISEEKLLVLIDLYKLGLRVDRLKTIHIVQAELKNEVVPYAA